MGTCDGADRLQGGGAENRTGPETDLAKIGALGSRDDHFAEVDHEVDRGDLRHLATTWSDLVDVFARHYLWNTADHVRAPRELHYLTQAARSRDYSNPMHTFLVTDRCLRPANGFPDPGECS